MKSKRILQYDEWLQQKMAKQKEEKLLQQKRASELEESRRLSDEKRKKERQIRYQDWCERKSRVKISSDGISNELKGFKKFYSNDLVSPESNFNAWLKKKTSEQKATEHKKLLERKRKEDQIESRKLAAQEAYDKWLQLKNLEMKHQKLVEKKQHAIDDEVRFTHPGYHSSRSEMSYSTMLKCKNKRPWVDNSTNNDFSVTDALMELDEETDGYNGSQTYRKSPNQLSVKRNKKSIATLKNYQKNGLYNPPKTRYSNLAKKMCKSPPLSA